MKKKVLRERAKSRLKNSKEEQAENRRKFLKSLNKKTRDFATREFAKLGLFQ